MKHRTARTVQDKLDDLYADTCDEVRHGIVRLCHTCRRPFLVATDESPKPFHCPQHREDYLL